MEQTLGTVVVAGAGPGIGLAAAQRFGAAGYRVALVARHVSKLDQLRDVLRKGGIDAESFAVDVGDVDATTEVMAVVRRWGGDDPQVLVYNAVAWARGPADEQGVTPLADALRVSVLGAAHLTSLLAPAMRRAGRGSLLFTGGGAAVQPIPGMATLCAAKAALRLWALSLAEDLAGTGVRVGTVTVDGYVAPDTTLDAARVAEAFMRLHHGRAEGAEIHLRP